MKLIVDGNNASYRSYCVMNLTTKSTGENVSAIYGVLAQLKSWLILFKNVSDVVVCWDSGKSKRRIQIYPEYKDKSKLRSTQTEEEYQAFLQFIDQMEQLHKFLPNLGVRSIKISGWEADDLAYGVTKVSTDEDLMLISTDQDYYQLIDDRVSVYNPVRGKLYAVSGVYMDANSKKGGVVQKPTKYFESGDAFVGTFRDEEGYNLSAALSVKVLTGDSSDNITGVPGLGEVTAKSLCAMYGGLPGIINAKSLIMMSKGGQSWRAKKLFDYLDVIKRNNLLINLSFVDLIDIIDTLKQELSYNVTVNDREVKRFFMSKEFVSLLSQYMSWVSSFHSLVT